ncbi:MAG TPA: hypothetical protein VJY62_01180 [Bacteroidia bacterium]|nr:hypothetical protein [Bacteroidia bacterium]
MKNSISLIILFTIIHIHCGFSQQYYLPLNREYNLRYEPWIYNLKSDMHTAMRPFISTEVSKNAPLDSLDSAHVKDNKFNSTLVGRKLRKEHLFHVKGEDYNFYLDPLFEQKGSYSNNRIDKFTYVNTRGAKISGNIGERFSFSTDFYESQSRFPDYIDSSIRTTKVVPGGARIKKLYGSFDYNIASGTISYSLKKYFNVQFGHDKVFIGDGYRSLLLSDNAFNYPFLKITTTIWKVQYTNLYCVFQDLLIPPPPGYPPEDFSFRKKYGSFHFLDLNIGKRASVGILEAIIWKSDSVRAKSFDINYINPFIFFRPVEFSLGSADNAMIGFNIKYKINNSNLLYIQFMLDEFKISEVRSGRGWWANKQAVQFGLKSYNVFAIKNLHLLTEFNFVRPYTYQHRSSLTAYGHYNESITHPLGANFYESVSKLNYKYKNFFTAAEVMYAVVGYDLKDSSDANINYGQNIFASYNTHPNEYGNRVGQGLKTKQLYIDFKIGYLVNPKTNLVIECGATSRTAKNNYGNHQTTFVYFGIRTNLTNRYYDF